MVSHLLPSYFKYVKVPFSRGKETQLPGIQGIGQNTPGCLVLLSPLWEEVAWAWWG